MRPILILLASASLSACKKDKDDNTTDPTGDTGPTTETDTDTDADVDADTDADTDTDTPTQGYMRVVHAAPLLAPLSIYGPPNPGPVLPNLAPLNGSSWSPIGVGDRVMAAGPAGGGQADIWDDTTVTIVAGQRYSLYLTGSGANVTLQSMEEDLAGIPPGQVRMMIVNAGEHLPPITVHDVQNDVTLVSNHAYGAGPAVQLATAGNIELGVDLDADGTLDVTFQLPGVGDQVTVPIYITIDGNEAVMIGHSPAGVDVVLRAPWGDVDTADTGDTGTTDTSDTAADTDTSTTDTGTTDTGTTDTGTTDTSTSHTSDTANDTGESHTGDTGL